MTVAELRNMLNEYPDDMPVTVYEDEEWKYYPVGRDTVGTMDVVARETPRDGKHWTDQWAGQGHPTVKVLVLNPAV